jgi:3'-5' exonuclease
MLRAITNETWFIDGEWIPDVATGRRVYGLATTVSDDEVMQAMWKAAGATVENPRPYLKVVLCRVVALTALVRRPSASGVKLKLVSQPDAGDIVPVDERALLQRFWTGVAENHPQLVGYNVGAADIAIAAQRALVHGLVVPDAFARPAKPWEGVDYFDDKNSQMVVDLKHALSPWERRDTPKLSEIALACGLPGKPGVSGSDVLPMWQAGEWRKVLRYNQCDVLTTFLLWLRMAVMSGRISEAAATDEREQVVMIAETEARGPEGELLRQWLVDLKALAG